MAPKNTRALRGWLENWYATNNNGPLIGAGVYLAATLVAFFVGMAGIGYIFTYFAARSRSVRGGSAFLVGGGIAFLLILCGCVYQFVTHRRHQIKLVFQKTSLYYAGYESVNGTANPLIGHEGAGENGNEFGGEFWVKIATFPGWLLVKCFESLADYRFMLAVNLPDAADVLDFMIRVNGRCFPPEIEDELPHADVPRALAFLLQINGITAIDAQTPAVIVGGDRLEEWGPLVDWDNE